jgi:crotonobetainyl-CoA:carnitine CoA-transferase CaiB-like acyl-CoA transferase
VSLSALASHPGDLVLAVGNDRQFQGLCEVLGADKLAADGRYATNPGRVRNRETLRAELERYLVRRPAAEWVQELTVARVPAGVVNDLAGAFAFAASLGLNPIVELPREDGETVPLARNPISLSATPPTYRSAPPALPTHERSAAAT